MSNATDVLESAKKYRDAELRKSEISPTGGVSPEVFAAVMSQLDEHSLRQIPREIEAWQSFRNRLSGYKAEFAQASADLLRDQVTFWSKPVMLWFLSILLLCVGIETIARVFRGFLPAAGKR
jgi:hypothetical protein